MATTSLEISPITQSLMHRSSFLLSRFGLAQMISIIFRMSRLKLRQAKEILIVANTSDTSQTFNVSYHKKAFTAMLVAGAVAIYIW